VPAFIRFQSLVRGYLQKQRYRTMGEAFLLVLLHSLMMTISHTDCQRLGRALSCVAPTTVRNVAYRSRVAHEILDTETFYVKSMNQCITVHQHTLIALPSPPPCLRLNVFLGVCRVVLTGLAQPAQRGHRFGLAADQCG
jgi:hypothetical protein